MQPHRRQPTRLPHPWGSPGKNTGVSCHFLLQCMKVKSESEVTQSCPTLSDPMDCSPPGSSIHGIFQARVLEWGAIAFSKIPAGCPTIQSILTQTAQNRHQTVQVRAQSHKDCPLFHMPIAILRLLICVYVCIYIYIYILPPLNLLTAPHSMWDLSSLTRDRTCIDRSLNTGQPGKSQASHASDGGSKLGVSMTPSSSATIS